MIELKLPYPVSSNKYWRRSGHKMHRSAEAKSFIEEVKWIAKSKKAVPTKSHYSLNIKLHPKMNKDGSTNKTVVDIDNALKVTLDALEGVIYENDNQVKQISIKYAEAVQGGALTVIAERLFADEG